MLELSLTELITKNRSASQNCCNETLKSNFISAFSFNAV